MRARSWQSLWFQPLLLFSPPDSTSDPCKFGPGLPDASGLSRAHIDTGPSASRLSPPSPRLLRLPVSFSLLSFFSASLFSSLSLSSFSSLSSLPPLAIDPSLSRAARDGVSEPLRTRRVLDHASSPRRVAFDSEHRGESHHISTHLSHYDVWAVADRVPYPVSVIRRSCGTGLSVQSTECGFALWVWEEHRVPAALRQHLTHCLQSFHPAVRNSWTFFPVPLRPSTRPPSRPSISSLHLARPPASPRIRWVRLPSVPIPYHQPALHDTPYRWGAHRGRRVSRAKRNALYDDVLLQTWMVPPRGRRLVFCNRGLGLRLESAR
jgi:hypothetical protein